MQNRLKVKRSMLIGTVALAGCNMVLDQQANAALSLTLSEVGVAPVTLTDTLNTGALSYFGSYGDFQTNFVVGVSDKLTGNSGVATLQIQSLDVTKTTNSGSKTLTISLTDDGYTFPVVAGLPDILTSSVGGTFTSVFAGDSVSFQSSVVSPPTSTAIQTYVAPTTVVGTTSFSSAAPPVAFIDPGTYSLQSTTQISLSGPSEQVSISGTSSVSVPEPTAALTLGIAGTVLLRRDNRKKPISPVSIA